MNELFSGKLAPITDTIGFLHCDAEVAASAFLDWERSVQIKRGVSLAENRIEGNFVECGVDRGGTATAVLNYNGEDSFINRKFFLFDTFEGLVAEQMSDGEAQRDHFSSDRYPSVYEDVKQRFSSLPFVLPIKGAVPDSLAAYDGGPVAYLHIDMNVALPECAAFEFFWPLLTKGAPVIFDDYGFPLHTEQREALDITAKKLGTTIMMLPTGQGLTWR